MPTDAARKQAHLEWYHHTDEESWSDDVEGWRLMEGDEYLAFLAAQEAILNRFEREFLRVGPLCPDAEQLGTKILRRIGKTLVCCIERSTTLLITHP